MLVRAARLYYLDGLGQGEVARALGVSRSSVSRILAAAREQGIVEIRIHDDTAGVTRHETLEARLAGRFGLAEVRVAASSEKYAPIDGVAQLAARCLEDLAGDVSTIGLSWGLTISKLAEEVDLSPGDHEVEVVPLVGGMPMLDVSPSGNASILTLARKFGVPPRRLHAPAIVGSALTQEVMLREPVIRSALDHAATVDLAFVGIGSWGVHASRRIITAMQLEEDELAGIEAAEVAGDICGQFFDIHGTPLGPPTSTRIIGLTLDQLRNLPTVVGMAAGAEKARGVVGALRTGILDGIVLDDQLAQAVLELEPRV